MDKNGLVPVIVGKNGKKIHAGYLYREDTKGRHIAKSYKQLCGSGECSTGHHWPSNIKVDPYHNLSDVNCEKCLQIMETDRVLPKPFKGD